MAITRAGELLPGLEATAGRGVVLDVGHGVRNFCFETAERAIARGIVPATISTDISLMSTNGPVYSLAETMSKFLLLGLALSDVVKMTTINAARALGLESRGGSLKPGMAADLSILELRGPTRDFVDSVGERRRGAVVLAPVATVKGGWVSYAAID